MANSGQRTQQVPQHVSALLSHLTSRPGVQSTLILSRKDGSIIQSTGQLAQMTEENGGSRTAQIPSATTDPTALSAAQPTEPSPTSPAVSQPYQPSQAETLAAHIFAFVSSAEALGVSLSRPTPTVQRPSDSHWDDNYDYGNEAGTAREEDRDGDDLDRDEDGEVKLLRMRTKKHEIVVVPDRKYLLCVVHDASPGGGPGASGSRSR
ncbi:hypothetical protein CBS147332_4775 [Penicillium roqueforti]|nr:hypothetical protein CBS147332_4775 [Penicillium roqueforti]KAI3114227.1 hypothetical protein CBS147331_4039 [Penicillium roqueforti]KAI3151146.1 hypothetical protein CBS147325_2653 [Penicillium roqueforti]KAI3174327.1 hypothetical protein DTO046C5_2759 [Penicillium roqueforti]